MWGTRLALPALVLATCCELGEECQEAGGSSGGQGEAESREVRRAWGPGTEGHRQRGACGPGRVRTGTVGGAVKGWDWQGGWPQKSWVPIVGNGPSLGAWAPGMGSPLGQAGKVRVTFPDSSAVVPEAGLRGCHGHPGEALGWGQQEVEKREADWISWGTYVSDTQTLTGPTPNLRRSWWGGPQPGCPIQEETEVSGRHSDSSGGRGPGCGGPAGAPMLEGEGQPTSLHPDPPASLWA